MKRDPVAGKEKKAGKGVRTSTTHVFNTGRWYCFSANFRKIIKYQHTFSSGKIWETLR